MTEIDAMRAIEEALTDLPADDQRRVLTWAEDRFIGSAIKGAATKARKRSAAALCPCCNRSFVQLRRHMATKHPDFEPEPAQ